MAKLQWRMDTLIGPLYLVASSRGLQSVLWKKQRIPMAKTLDAAGPEAKILARAARQLGEYLGGRRKKFSLPLDVEGTPFQKSVWDELEKIPYAETHSYRDVARRLKNAKAVRAVGSANGRNPVCIIVPCHRVIAHDGLLGGYSGGLEIKRKLLALEQAGRVS